MTLQCADDDIDAEAAPSGDLLPSPDSDTPPPRGSRRRLTRRARWVLIGALVLSLAGGGVGVWALFFRTPAATTTFRTVTVSQDTLKQAVSGTGTINPATQSDLSFASSGTVTSVDVEPGDLVTKGEELAAIDDSELEIDYESAKASRTEAEEALSTLEDDDDATATAIAAAEATVKVRKNAVTQAKSALDAATMVSPIDGKVAAVTVAEGDTVSGGTSTSGSLGSSGTSSGTGTGTAASSSSKAAITVISNGTFTVTTSVSNADVTSIKKGLQATITPTSSTDPVFGTVSTVGVVASTSTSTTAASSGSATFPVTIKVTGTHKDLLPGSSATVAITVKQLTNVISLPTQAVTTADGKTVVQKLVDGKQVPTEVTLGASVGASTVITKGLNVGDQVVLTSFRATGGTGGTGQGTRNGGVTGGTQGGAGGGLPAGRFPGQGQGNQVGTR